MSAQKTVTAVPTPPLQFYLDTRGDAYAALSPSEKNTYYAGMLEATGLLLRHERGAHALREFVRSFNAGAAPQTLRTADEMRAYYGALPQ